MKPKIISHAGLTINLADLKSIKLSIFDTTNTMIVEFKTRYDYILHPKTQEYEKQEYNEKTEVEFPDYETAISYRTEVEQIWEEYLRTEK
jgi:hypothetical protein